MASKPAEKIIEALNHLMEGYAELQESIRIDLGDEKEEDILEIETALATEMRAALETLIDGEDYSAEEIATLLSSLTQALEEIDPDVFESDLDEDEVDDDDDNDDDEYDYDEDDEEGEIEADDE